MAVAMNKPIYGEEIDPLYGGFLFNIPDLKPKPDSSWVILGPSGAGKESRGKYLVSKFSLDGGKISSGDIFRKILEGITEPQMNKIKELGKSLGKKLKKKARDYDYVIKVFTEYGIKYSDKKQAVAAFQTLNGLFVDDDILLKYAENQLKEYKGKKLVLDGHIRTKRQVSGILELAKRYDINAGYVLLVHTPLHVLEKRTVARLNCPKCKRDYNATAEKDSENYPADVQVDKQGLPQGKCRYDESVLIRRADDYPEKVETRLNEYGKNIRGVLKALNKAKIPIFVVSGYLNPYTKEKMAGSMEKTLTCQNQEVLAGF